MISTKRSRRRTTISSDEIAGFLNEIDKSTASVTLQTNNENMINGLVLCDPRRDENNEIVLIRQFCSGSLNKLESIRIAKKIQQTTKYKLLPERMMYPEKFLHPSTSIESKKEIIMSMQASNQESERQKKNDSLNCEAFTKCRVVKGRGSTYEYMDTITCAIVPPAEYEKRYLQYLLTVRLSKEPAIKVQSSCVLEPTLTPGTDTTTSTRDSSRRATLNTYKVSLTRTASHDSIESRGLSMHRSMNGLAVNDTVSASPLDDIASSEVTAHLKVGLLPSQSDELIKSDISCGVENFSSLRLATRRTTFRSRRETLSPTAQNDIQQSAIEEDLNGTNPCALQDKNNEVILSDKQELNAMFSDFGNSSEGAAAVQIRPVSFLSSRISSRSKHRRESFVLPSAEDLLHGVEREGSHASDHTSSVDSTVAAECTSVHIFSSLDQRNTEAPVLLTVPVAVSAIEPIGAVVSSERRLRFRESRARRTSIDIVPASELLQILEVDGVDTCVSLKSTKEQQQMLDKNLICTGMMERCDGVSEGRVEIPIVAAGTGVASPSERSKEWPEKEIDMDKCDVSGTNRALQMSSVEYASVNEGCSSLASVSERFPLELEIPTNAIEIRFPSTSTTPLLSPTPVVEDEKFSSVVVMRNDDGVIVDFGAKEGDDNDDDDGDDFSLEISIDLDPLHTTANQSLFERMDQQEGERDVFEEMLEDVVDVDLSGLPAPQNNILDEYRLCTEGDSECNDTDLASHPTSTMCSDQKLACEQSVDAGTVEVQPQLGGDIAPLRSGSGFGELLRQADENASARLYFRVQQARWKYEWEMVSVHAVQTARQRLLRSAGSGLSQCEERGVGHSG